MTLPAAYVKRCREKRVYRNKPQAMHYAVMQRLLPYKCGACHRWHLTSQGLR